MAFENLSIKGFGRLEFRNAKTDHLDSWTEWENTVMQTGFDDFLVSGLSADLADGAAISHGAIGSTTTAPDSTNTTLAGEFETRQDLTGTLASVGTLSNTWSYGTNQATQSNVARVGLFNAVTNGKMFSEATFTSSAKTTDQTLSISYEIRFS